MKNNEIKTIFENIKREIWDEGMNMGGEYQGVWVRFRDIERIIDKHMPKEEAGSEGKE